MKLSEATWCLLCRKVVREENAISWFAVAFSPVILNPQATNVTMGLARMFQGNVALAEIMTSNPEAITVVTEKPEWNHICIGCYGKHFESLFTRMEESKKEWENAKMQNPRT